MRIKREQLQVQLSTLFHVYGFDGTSIARLAEFVGLQKSGLYHHFPEGKDSMARMVLEQFREWDEASTLETGHGPGTPRERLERILANIKHVNRNTAQISTLDVFTIGEARERFLPEVQTLYEVRRSLLRELATEAGVPEEEREGRLDDFFVCLEGAHVMFRVIDNFELFHRTLSKLPDILFGEHRGFGDLFR